MVAAGTPSLTHNASIMTQEAVVHGISDISARQDDSMMVMASFAKALDHGVRGRQSVTYRASLLNLNHPHHTLPL